MKLAFKSWGYGYHTKEVDIRLRIGTLEDLCEENNLEFGDIGNKEKITPYDFMTELLWHGYLTACEKNHKKPKYTKLQAWFWNEQLSQEARLDLQKKIDELMGSIKNMTGSKKKVKTD